MPGRFSHRQAAHRQTRRHASADAARALLAATQEPLAASALQQPSGVSAWATNRSYDMYGTQDMVIPPAEQAFTAGRAHATVVTVPGGSHLTLISHPGGAERLIERAAEASH